MKPTCTRNVFLLAGLLLMAGVSTMKAGTGNDTWSGGGGDNNWSTTGNWTVTSSNIPPASGDTPVFSGSTRLAPNNNLTVDTGFLGLTFNANASSFTLTGNEIISTGGIVDNSTNLQIINMPLSFTNTHSLSAVSGGTMVINSIISGAGGTTKNGNGTVTLTGASAGANTYTGTTTINAGNLTLDFTTGGSTPAANIVSSSSILTAAGGTLNINGNISGTSSQTFASTTFSPGLSTINVSSNTSTLVLGAATYSLGGIVRFNGPTTMDATGAVVPATGTITTTTVGNGAFGVVQPPSPFTGNPATVGLYDWASTDVAGGTAGASPYTIIGGSQVTGFYVNAFGGNFDMLVNTTTGTGNPQANTVRFNTPAAISLTERGNFLVGGFLITPNMGATNVSILIGASGGPWQINRVTSPAGNQEGVIWQNNTLGYFIMNPQISNGRDTGDNNYIVKAGQGTVVFANSAAVYIGQTYVNEGYLVITGNGAIGDQPTGAALNLNGGGLFGNATFALNNGGSTPRRAVNLLGNGGSLAAAAGFTMTIDGVVGGAAGTGSLTIGIPASSANGNVRGLLPGTGSIASGQAVDTANTTPVFANGTVTLTGANTHFGGTIVQSGTLNINGINALGGANYGGLTLNGGTLQYAVAFSGNGSGDLTSIGTAGVTLAGSDTIDVNGNAVTYAGSVGNGGNGALTVLSTAPGGVLNLNSNNTYTGGTTITNGTLLVNNTTGSGTGSGGVTVQNAGTFGGTGIISGSVNWQSGSKASFTKGSPLTVGVVTLNNNSTTVNVPGGTPLPAGTYTLMNYTAAGSSGAFSTGAPTYTGAGVAPGTVSTISTSGGVVTLSVVSSGLVAAWTNDVDSAWSVATNWSSNPTVPHSAGDAATFGVGSALRTVTLDANESVGGILMTNPNSFVIANSGKTLTLDGAGFGASVSVSAGTQNAINTAVALNDNVTTTVGTGDSLAISGVVSNSISGAKTLTFNGAGTNILSAANSYGPAAGTVGTTLSGGTLQVGTSSSLGAGDVNIPASSTLQPGVGGLNIPNNIAVGFSQVVTVNNNGNSLTLGGAITGSGALTEVGAGTLILNGNNTYSGNTTVNAGILSVSSSANIANTPAITLNGGDLLGNGTLTANGNIKIGPVSGTAGTNALIDVATGQVFILTGVIASAGNSGTNSLTVNSGTGNNGVLVLSNSNTFNGPTTIANGTLQLANSLALQNSTLNYNSGNLTFSNITAATLAGLSGVNSAVGIALTNAAGAAVTLTVGNGASTTYGGILSDLGSLGKVGTGTLTLSNATYTGNTVIYGGGLVIDSPSVLNSHLDISAQLNTANVSINGATLTSSNGLYITSPTGGVGGTVFGNSATLTITNGAQVTAYADANGRALSYGAATAAGSGERPGGNGSLTVGTIGDLATTVTANGALDMFATSGGGTVGNFALNLNGGTLAVNNIKQTTVGSPATADTSTFNFNGGILKPLTNDADIATVFIPATPTQMSVVVNSNGAVFNENGFTNTIAAVLAHGNGTPDGGLTVFGKGILNLSGVNTYTGPTVVTNGTLQVNSAGGTGANVVNVMTNGTLGGSGTISGDVTINSGGHTLPGGYLGNATGFVTTMGGNLTYNAGAEADFNLSATYNSGNDQIVLNGASSVLTGNNVKIGINVTDLVNTNLDSTADYVLFTNLTGTIASGFSFSPVWLGLTPTNAANFSIINGGNYVSLHYSPISVVTLSVSPNPAKHGDFVTFTVDASSTAGSIASVVVDVSAINTGTLSLIQSNGTSVWTNSIAVSSSTPVGNKTLNVTITDGVGNLNVVPVSLTIVGSPEVWNGGGLLNTWGTGANWLSGVSPLPGDLVTFAGTTKLKPNLEVPYSISSLTFSNNAGSFNITNDGSSTLTLTGNVTNNSTSGQTLSVPVALSGVPVINTALGNITVSNIVSDGVAGSGLTKAGVNTLTLVANDTYTGPTTVNNGVLALVGNNSAATGAVTNNATLQLANPNAVAGSQLVLNNGSTLQLRADVSTSFAMTGITVTNPPNVTDVLTFDVNPLTSAVGQTLSLNSALNFPTNVSPTINVTGNSSYVLSLGDITMSSGNRTPSYYNLIVNALSAGPGVVINSVSSGNWGEYINAIGGGKVTITGNLADTSNGSFVLYVNGGTTVTLQGATVKTGSTDAYKYQVANGTLVLDNGSALTNNTTGTGGAQSLFILGAATNNFSLAGYVAPAGVLVATNNSFNAAVYLGDATSFATGGLTNNARNTNYVSDGDIGFTNSGVFTIGGQNTSGVNVYANPIILGLTPNLGKGVTLVAATGGEVDFTGGILPNGTDTTAGVTVGDATHGGIIGFPTANTYGGGTLVTNGTLLVSNPSGSATGAGTVTVIKNGVLLINGLVSGNVNVTNGGTLGGILGSSGSIAGVVTNQSGGNLVPGRGTNVIGTVLNLGGNLILSAGSTTTMAVSHNGATNDQVSMGGGVNYGGTLTVVTNAGDSAFVNGDKFTLFKGFYVPTSSFTASNLPPLTSGLVWDTTGLTNDGSIKVVTGSVTPPPVAGIGALTATNIFAGQSVVFTNTSSGSITNWIWNFGNGTSVTNASGINVTNAYGSVGSYLVNLTVAGAGGSGTSGNLTVTVKGKVSLGKPVLSGGSLILGGTNGPAGQQYRILSSTNVALNVTNWVAVWTNVFATDGSYSYTNSPLTNKATFFKLVSP